MTMALPDIINVYLSKHAAFNPIAASFIELLRKRLEAEVI